MCTVCVGVYTVYNYNGDITILMHVAIRGISISNKEHGCAHTII